MMKGAFHGYFKSIGVSSDYRGKGIGSRLMDFAEDRIFRDTVNARAQFNAPAMRFYEKREYTKIGEIPDYIIEVYSERIMRKTIGPLSD